MTIKSITIEKYKSFLEPVTIPFSPHFNVFIGPNNCGKTNILDAIDFLAHPEKDPNRLHHPRTKIRMNVELDAKERTQFKRGKNINVDGHEYSVDVSDEQGKRLQKKLYRHIASRIKMLSYEDFGDFVQIEKDYTALAQKYPRVFKRMMKLFQSYFPEVKAIEKIVDVKSDNFGTVALGSKSVTIARLGGGFRRILVILLYAFHPEYSALLIDEPEIHLHPGMIKKLIKGITAGDTNQVIVTSHSPLFVSAYTLQHVYRVLKDEQGSHVYSLAQSGQHIDRQRLVQELNADNLEMFFADKVLLVEGVSDRILMRGLIDRFYEGPYDIKVIYTHGKSNIDVYIDLMKTFHIPYVVMLDRDALHNVAHNFGIRVRPHGKHNKNHRAYVYERLREHHNIVVLDNGSIERNYPSKYQIKDSKPLNALYAAANITREEYFSPRLRNLRMVIEELAQ